MVDEIREPSFWIMTVLAAGRSHGYRLMAETARLSGGDVALKATTLYAALDRLERQGLIAADGDEQVDGRVRRYFVLTDAGSARLARDAERVERMAEAARAVLRRPRSAGGVAFDGVTP